MRISLARSLTIAKREYLTTVRRRAFVLTLILLPAWLAFATLVPSLMAGNSAAERLASLHTIALVDSSGALGEAPPTMEFDLSSSGRLFGGARKKSSLPDRFTAEVQRYPNLADADTDLRAGKVGMILIVPADYLATGRVRRYQKEAGIFGSGTQDRTLDVWLARALATGSDSLRAERTANPTATIQEYALDRHDHWKVKDPLSEGLDLFLPFGVAMLLGMSIVIGGQYLLQGVTEEKESRILESLLCTVTPEELMMGKLLGLGTAGMTLVVAWVVAGMMFGGPVSALIGARFSPFLVITGVTYFALGYLFYASLMTAVGAIAGNLREAQQIAYVFTISNFAPVFVWTSTVDRPNGPVPTVLSLIPLTAPTSMLMRLSTGAAVPAWQIVASLVLLIGAAALAVFVGSRIFRTGLLMYGKTPNLPEILRWVREA